MEKQTIYVFKWRLKGIVQRELTGVKISINRQLFLHRIGAGSSFFYIF
jgi:hypothetical protein